MTRLNRHDFPGAVYHDRVIQFGEGNFLRAFIDWQLDWLNEHQERMPVWWWSGRAIAKSATR